MRTTCLVNNYNYRRFVGEAVESALAQTVPFDEIIVVDDGSTDDSLSFLRREYAAEPHVKVVAKTNEGQLSAFHEGVRQATGEVLFFLDADDRYRPEYLHKALAVYQERPIDFVTAGFMCFGPASNWNCRPAPRRDLGYSTIGTMLGRMYVGRLTSAISMRRSIAKQVLPYPFEEDWRTRADDVLILGASMVGARKFDLGDLLVEYRLHGENNHVCRRETPEKKYHHGMAVNRLLCWYVGQVGLAMTDLPQLLHREFATIEKPTRHELWAYLWMSWRAKLTWRMRARHWGEMGLHFVKELNRKSKQSKITHQDEATTASDAPTIAIDKKRRAA